MDESQDTAVSFRYFSIVEAEASRARQRQAVPVAEAEETVQKQPETSGDTKVMDASARLNNSDAEAAEAPAEPATPKGKRRVTFDIKVDAADADERDDKDEQSRDAEGMACISVRVLLLIHTQR